MVPMYKYYVNEGVRFGVVIDSLKKKSHDIMRTGATYADAGLSAIPPGSNLVSNAIEPYALKREALNKNISRGVDLRKFGDTKREHYSIKRNLGRLGNAAKIGASIANAAT